MGVRHVRGHHNAHSPSDCIAGISLPADMLRTVLFKPAFSEDLYPWRIGKSNRKTFLKSFKLFFKMQKVRPYYSEKTSWNYLLSLLESG